jgi:hypothetical protein
VVRLLASGLRLPLLALACAGLSACATEADNSGQTLGGPGPGAGTGGGGTAATTGGGGSTSTGGGGSPTATGGGGSSAGSGDAGTTTTAGTASEGGSGGSTGGSGGGGSSGASGNDMCPDDPEKTAPGKCGCGAPDEDSVNGAGCAPLQNSIVHRYSFETDAKDSVGTAHGTLAGGAAVAGGALTLSGDGQYLNLPNSIISSLSSVTIEVYLTWTGDAGNDWQRIFDFGSSDMGEDQAGAGAKYLFLSARKFRGCYTSATPKAEVFVDANKTLPTTAAQVALVVDGGKSLEVFLNGQSTGKTNLTLPLSALTDNNNWIGRSQYATDPYFQGKISEFRIYSAALTGPQLVTSIAMGENTTYLKKQ